MNRFFTVLILFLSFFVFSCKSSKDIPEVAKNAETQNKAETDSSAKPEIKSNTGKIPNQSISNPNIDPSGSKPR